MSDPDALQALPQLLAALRQDPRDEAARAALSDALSEEEPSFVRRNHCPGWLSTLWRRTHPERRPRYWWNASEEMRRSVDSDSWRVFDHCGSSVVAGCRCFVTEPYTPREELLPLLLPLALGLGCACVTLERGIHFVSVSRGVIFEPLVMPPPLKKRRTRVRIV